jgi:inner membrane protein
LVPTKSRRYSLIPHRTLTHTLSLWLVCFIYAAIELGGVSSSYLNLFAFGFCASVLAHLLLDMRTPMGIPLLPFGKRFRLDGFRLRPAHVIQPRAGW